MSKTAIVDVISDLPKIDWIPPSSALILEFDHIPYDRARVDAWLGGGLEVALLRALVGTLNDADIDAFTAQGSPVIVVADTPPSISDALMAAPRLRRENVTVELPLSTDEHLDVLKVLSSLGVKTRVAPEVLASSAEVVLEALEDALLKPGTRATVSPFQELDDERLNEDFELAKLDFRHNDHFVDLREASEAPQASAWEDVVVATKRVPFLMAQRPCAYCEGLLYCHGYLGEGEACRAFFSNFMELLDLASSRPKAANREPQSANHQRRPRPPPQESKW